MEISGTCRGDEGETLGGSGGAAAAAISRWSPTKEQIGILEELYRQGIRTPTAEQIQQITGRLRVYGHIEGKNVFYWFQNHKARQRRRQKQDSLALLRRYLYHCHRPAAAAAVAPFPSHCPNVIYGPYCMPSSELGGFYPIHPKLLLPCVGNNRRQWSDFIKSIEARRQRAHNSSQWLDNCYGFMKTVENDAFTDNYETTRRTLDLFPLHPTTGSVGGNVEEIALAAPPGSSEVLEAGSKEQHQAYFDFFS